MNIFEILSSGSNGLGEVHINAILGWLLDPKHDHGLGMEVLKRITSELFADTPLHKEIKESEYSGVEMGRYRRRIETTIECDKDVVCSNKQKNRDIDVVATINGKFILAFENKIRSGSKEPGQVEDEISGLVESESDIAKNNGIYFIYLVKQDNELDYAKKELQKSHGATIGALSWISNNNLSMSKILQSIIIDHTQGKINPIPSETAFLLQSFIRFVENGFSYYLGQKDGTKRCLFNDLETLDPSYFVGFMGGIKILENTLKNKDDRKYLQYERPYKISRNKPNDNWIPLQDFLDCWKK